MKNYEKNLAVIFLITLSIVISFEFIFYNSTELYLGASNHVAVLVNLSMSYMAGWIIYFISVQFPDYQDRKKLEKTINHRLVWVKFYCWSILNSASDDHFNESIYKEKPIHIHDFAKSVIDKKLNQPVKRSRYMEVQNLKPEPSKADLVNFAQIKHLTNSVLKAEEYKKLQVELTILEKRHHVESMKHHRKYTIAENISYSASNLLNSIDRLLKLQHHLDASLIELVSEIEENLVVSNYQTYFEREDLLNRSPALYTKYFISLDKTFKKLQKY